MKKNPLPILAFLLLMIVTSCINETEKDAQTIIKGKYHPAESVLYLDEVHASYIKRLDSVELSDDGEFHFEVSSPDYALFKLIHSDLYPIILVAKDGDVVSVDQTNDPAWPFAVEGNEECILLVEYLEKLNRDEYKIDSLSAIFLSSQSNPDFLSIREELNKAFISIHESHKAWARDFVGKNPGSFAALVMINSFFKEFLLFDQKSDVNYYKMVADAVMNSMPENQYAIDLNEHVQKIEKQNQIDAEAMARLAPGKKMPDFSVFTKENADINPKDFLDKNLLIYFWAANNAPSRQANPYIKAAYDQYSAHNLEIITISFDRSAEVWDAAIALDELPGIHCIETSGPGSPVQKLFNIKMHLPLYYLVDKEGNIFSSGRDFKALNEELTELTKAAQ